MLAVTRTAHRKATEPQPAATDVTPCDWDAVRVESTEAQTRQFVTL